MLWQTITANCGLLEPQFVQTNKPSALSSKSKGDMLIAKDSPTQYTVLMLVEEPQENFASE